jgi:hypothetical protein
MQVQAAGLLAVGSWMCSAALHGDAHGNDAGYVWAKELVCCETLQSHMMACLLVQGVTGRRSAACCWVSHLLTDPHEKVVSRDSSAWSTWIPFKVPVRLTILTCTVDCPECIGFHVVR